MLQIIRIKLKTSQPEEETFERLKSLLEDEDFELTYLEVAGKKSTVNYGK